MIRDLSKTLEAILNQSGLPSELAEARIVFDRPVESFNPQETVINVFLYDVRENLELRNNEPTIERDSNSGKAAIVRPPMRTDCTYLITAWPFGGTELALQEHRLLSQVLQVLSRYRTIPKQFLQGSLREQKPPLPLTISSVDGLKNPAEFWTALGTPLRAALAATITISLELLPDGTKLPETYLVRETKLRLEQDHFVLEGEVQDINYQPVAGAEVQLLESENEPKTTKYDGYFSFSLIPAGVYTLQVTPKTGKVQNFPVTVPPLGGGKYKLRLT